MAFSTPIPTPTAQGLDMRMASDIMETIARSREVIQQAREAMVRANLISEAQTDHAPKHPSP